MRRISTLPKTSRESARQHKSRKKSGQGSAPKPSSQLRPASRTTSSSRSLLRITASRTGFFVITPKMGSEFVETLPIRNFHGVGPATAAKMGRLGIKTGLDLRSQTLAFLQQHFGKAGCYYYWAARGIDERPVRADRIRKSVGVENTFPADLLTCKAARDALREIVDKVWRYCEGAQPTAELKIRGGGTPYSNMALMPTERMGPPPGALPPMRMTASWSRIQTVLPHTSLWHEDAPQ